MVNQIVFHKTFGKGVIIEINRETRMILVDFNNSIHGFRFPDAFEKFLTAENSDIQAFALAKLQDTKATR